MNKIISRVHKKYYSYKKVQKEKPEKKRDKHGTTADWVSNFVNIIIAGFTIGLFYLTSNAIQKAADANTISKSSLDYTKRKDSIENISNYIKDSINKSQIDSSLSITKRSSYAATSSLELYKKLAEATQTQAKVSTNSAKFYKESFQLQNRAYLVVNTLDISYISDDSIKIDLGLKNVGKTPANNVRAKIVVCVSENENMVDTNWINQKYFGETPSVIGTEQTSQYSKATNIIKYFKNDFINHKISFFVMFKVQYFDVFGIEHRTRLFAINKYGEKDFGTCNKYNDFY